MPGFVRISYDVGKREHRKRTRKRLHTARRDLLRAYTVDEVTGHVAGRTEDVLGYPLTGVRILNEETDRLDPVVVRQAARLQMGQRPVYGVSRRSS